MTPPALPPLLDLTGIAIFALSGALLAVRMRQTFVTLAFFALVTGVGETAECSPGSRRSPTGR